MAERTDQRTRDSDVSVDVDTDFGSVLDDGDTSSPSESRSGGGLRSRVAQRVDGFFSVRTFGIALVLTVALSFVIGSFLPVPGGALLGVFAGAAMLGLASDDRSYLEVGTATLLSGAVTALLSNLLVSLAGFGVPIVAIGAGASGLAGIVGHYVGRDLRAGLTRDL